MSVSKLEQDLLPLQNAEKEACAEYEKKHAQSRCERRIRECGNEILEFEVRLELARDTLNLCEKVTRSLRS